MRVLSACFLVGIVTLPGAQRGCNDGEWKPRIGPESSVGVRQQLTTEGSVDFMSAWSPDGTQIVFASTRGGRFGLWVTAAEGGGGFRQVTAPAGEYVMDILPDWAPRGDMVAFASNRGGPFQVWAVRTDGALLTQLTSFPYGAYEPAWSPDADMIAFTGVDTSGRESVWTMSAGGSTLRQLGTGRSPRWTPDGRSLFFARDTTDAKGKRRNWDIYSMDTQGTNVTQITSDESLQEFSPNLSPDGRWLAYVAIKGRSLLVISKGGLAQFEREHPDYEIWLKDLTAPGRSPIQVTQSSGVDAMPRWSPDGRRIMVSSDRGGNFDLWLIEPVLPETRPE